MIWRPRFRLGSGSVEARPGNYAAARSLADGGFSRGGPLVRPGLIMSDLGSVSRRAPGEPPGAVPSVEEVLGQALARFGRSVTAFRDGRRPFTDKDRAAAGRDLGQIAARLSLAMVGGAVPPSPGHAASLWLSEDGELLSATRTGQEWLDRLRTSDMPGRADAVLAGLAVRGDCHHGRFWPGQAPHAR